MGLLEVASADLVWRGMDYYKDKNTIALYFTLSKTELREQLLNALILLEDRRNDYW